MSQRRPLYVYAMSPSLFSNMDNNEKETIPRLGAKLRVVSWNVPSVTREGSAYLIATDDSLSVNTINQITRLETTSERDAELARYLKIVAAGEVWPLTRWAFTTHWFHKLQKHCEKVFIYEDDVDRHTLRAIPQDNHNNIARMEVSLQGANGSAGIVVDVSGYGINEEDFLRSDIIRIDYHEGAPRVRVWSDINHQGPTHTITCEKAMLDNRQV